MFEDMGTPPGLGGIETPPGFEIPLSPFAGDITVHHFTRGPMPLSSSLSLETGRRVAQSAISDRGWCSVKLTWNSLSYLPHRGYSYYPAPPVFTVEKQVSPPELKEWGSPASEDEVFITHDLEEFRVTDLTFLSSLVVKPSALPQSPFSDSFSDADLYATAPVLTLPAKRNSFEDSLSDAELYAEAPTPARVLESKHRPLEDCDNSSLHRVIPEPHFFPPLAQGTSFLIQERILPFNKTTPTPIPPHTLTSVRQHLNTSYARGAWIIPIRGLPPWQGSTPGVVVKENALPAPSFHPSSLYTGDKTRYPEITWTRTSLVAFWTFLLHTRQARTLGHVSLSFNPAPVATPPPIAAIDTSFGYELSQDVIQPATYPPSQQSQGPYWGGKSLLTMDHFKIYCDVEFAMYIRSALDAWFVEWNQATSERSRVNRKARVRPLEGARIVFVDESSRGLFIS